VTDGQISRWDVLVKMQFPVETAARDQSSLEATEHGLVADGWFVVNAAEALMARKGGRGFYCDSRATRTHAGRDQHPDASAGEPMAMYHWEADRETSQCSR
jgi:hypothetical protein